jgi:hypothetical protein
MIGEKKLIMSYQDKEYVLFDKLTKDFWSNLLVEIKTIDGNSELTIHVTHDFSL